MPTITLSTAPQTNSIRWAEQEVTWEGLLDWLDLEHPADRKEAGNYVLGKLRGGVRRKDSVEYRSPVLVLDADSAAPTFADNYELLHGHAAFLHTTWSHGKKGCRYRLGVLASREMTADEYRRCAVVLMHRLGREQFDAGSAQAERYMFRPSTQVLDTYEHRVIKGDPVDVDQLLAEYDALRVAEGANSPPQALTTTPGLNRAESVPEDVVHERVGRAIQDLDALAVLPPGARMPWPGIPEGVGWDDGVWFVAQRLVEAANSGTGYTLDNALEDFTKHAPQADGNYDPRWKWDKAVREVANRAMPYTGASADFTPVPGTKDERPSSTWAGLDLSGYLDGTYTAPVPKLLTRTDGVSLLYPGLTHSIHGESESGKSMVVQHESVVRIMAGEHVLYLDFESDPGSIVERLLLLGATREALVARFVYVQPATDPDRAAHDLDALLATLDAHPYTLAVIDGVSESMDIVAGSGTDPNASAIEWTRKVPRRIADRTGAAVVQIDHVTKNAETRGRFAIGGQAKMSALTGAAYAVDVVAPLGRGLRGELALRVAKDRPGYVRGRSGEHRASDRTQEAARIVVDSTGTALVVTVNPPHVGPSADQAQAGLMEQVSTYLADLAQMDPDHPGASSNTVRRDITGKNASIDAALNALVAQGYVTVTVKGQSRLHRLTKAYLPDFEEAGNE